MGLLFVPKSTSDPQDSRGILFESVNLVELGGAHKFVIFFQISSVLFDAK